MQDMMIERNANEEAIDKWTAELDEKLQKIASSLIASSISAIGFFYICHWRGENQSKRKTKKKSYLKEMVIPKVRLLIDGLPCNTEGYKGENKNLENQVIL